MLWMCLLDASQIRTKKLSVWKFIEFEGSGRPHDGDGMIEAFHCLQSPQSPPGLTKKQTGVARAVRGRTGPRHSELSALVGGDRRAETQQWQHLVTGQKCRDALS